MMKSIIETKRLHLREFSLNDAKDLFLLNSDPDVIKYTGDNHFKNLEEAQQLIINYDQYEKYKMGRLTVLLKETNEYLGWCGLKYHNESDEVDIGFRFFKKEWGKGYATEAAVACLKYGFETLKLKRIIGRVLKDNIASINVMKKIGMHFEREELLHGMQGFIYSIEK
jgi:ribosomal-protein-alanine N-acetyltransferase